ncbi:MAG: PQQ-binding-like beta-propeller repeat protein [candidate division WOR-3 bacterium]
MKWKYQAGGPIVTSPSIGSDGTIYFGADYYFYALNQDGTLKWQYQLDGKVSSSPAINTDGTIYFGTTDCSCLFALNAEGTLKWRYNTGGAIHSSPAIGSDGTIYFGCNDYNFYALNPDGSLKWSLRQAMQFQARQQLPLMVQSILAQMMAFFTP